MLFFASASDRQSSPSKDLQTQQPADEGQTSTSPEQQHPPVAESTSSVTDERIIRLEHLLKRVSSTRNASLLLKSEFAVLRHFKRQKFPQA